MIFGKIKSLLAVLALALLLAPAAQAAPAKLSSAWMGEHETFWWRGTPNSRAGTRKPGLI